MTELMFGFYAAMVTALKAMLKKAQSPHADFGRVQALQEYIEGSSYNLWSADPDNATTLPDDRR